METDVACQLFKDAIKDQVKYTSYVGDDDSTTLAELVKKVPYELHKFSDIIHIKRSLGTRLYNLSQRVKFPDSSSLSQKVINYLQKCFSYCIHQNKNNPSQLSKEIKAIIPHAFGDHSKCSPMWCRFHEGPLGYTHHELPYGKDLHGEQLKSALESIMSDYTTDVVLSKLAPCLNSQRNESLNRTIGSKNLKIRYYGGSESSDYRIACGVAQKNEGHQYISNTLESFGITPCQFCSTYHSNLDKKQGKDNDRKAKPEFKIKRRKLYQDKCSKQARIESKERATYQSNIGLNLDPNIPPQAPGKENKKYPILEEIDMNEATSVVHSCEGLIGNVLSRPNVLPPTFNDDNCYKSLVFDTETTTIRRSAEIIQIAATTTEDQDAQTFSQYIKPNTLITKAASNIHGIQSFIVNGEQVMHKDGVRIAGRTKQECLTSFVDFIKITQEKCKEKTNKPFACTVLIGHNVSTFDTPILLRSGTSTFLNELKSLKVMFADSLVLMKQLRTSSINSSLLSRVPDNKLGTLYAGFFGE